MRMVWWITRISLKEKKRNNEIRKIAEVVCVSEKGTKMALQIPVIGKRSQGRQQKRWKIKMNMEGKGLTLDDTKDRDV